MVNLAPGPTFAAVTALGGQTNDPTDPFARVVYNNANSTNDIENYGLSMQMDGELGSGTVTAITAYRKTNWLAGQDPDFTSADLVGLLQDTEIGTFTQACSTFRTRSTRRGRCVTAPSFGPTPISSYSRRAAGR